MAQLTRRRFCTSRLAIGFLAALVASLTVLFVGTAGAFGQVSSPRPGFVAAVAAPTPPPKPLLFVGDSVAKGIDTAGALPALRSALPGFEVTFDAADNRTTLVGAGALLSHTPSGFDTIVIALGDDDTGSPTLFGGRVQLLLGQLKAVPHVYWLTMREAGSHAARAKQANGALTQVASTFPNVRIIDWNAFAASLPASQFAADGVHLSAASATAMDGLIGDAVKGTSPYLRAPGVAPPPGGPTSAAAPPSTRATSTKSSATANVPLIGGIAAGAVVIIGVLAGVVGWRRRRRKRRAEARQAKLDRFFGGDAPDAPDATAVPEEPTDTTAPSTSTGSS